MKILRHGKTSWFAGAALFLAVFAASASAQGQYCEISLTACPQDYHGDTLVVPPEAIAISTMIKACGYADSAATVGGGAVEPPSIVFIIDQSSSMYGAGYDPDANRYKVTSALLDTLYTRVPDAEVGIVVFRGDLSFNYRTTGNASQTASHDPNLFDYSGIVGLSGQTGNQYGAYLPLVKLNDENLQRDGYLSRDSTHSAGMNGIDVADGTFIGYDLLKNAVKVKDTIYSGRDCNNSNARCGQDWAYRPMAGNNGTNISMAFDAARHALLSATAPRENQYIIFISDGEANRPGGSTTACPAGTGTNAVQCNHYKLGIDVPTTFTVFLDPNGVANQNLVEMSDAIRENNQDSSAIWALTSNYDDLLELMMENIINPMLTTAEGEVKSIVISSGNVSDSTASFDGDNFAFSRRMLPIDTSEVMEIDMSVRYDVRIDSTYTLEDGRDTTVTLRIAKDSLFIYSFHVRRSGEYADDWLEAQGLGEVCGAQPTLDLKYRGESLIGGEIKEYMDMLTIEFDNTGGLFRYDSVVVYVMNSEGAFVEVDLERFRMNQVGSTGVYNIDFRRLAASAAVPGDGRLQHAALDSVIVVFRNPQMPLDTLRLSVPYVSTDMAFYDAPGNPAGGSRLPDTIKVTAGDTTNIFAKFFKEDGSWDSLFLHDPTAVIDWTVSDPSAAKVAGNDDNLEHGIFYSEVANRTYAVTATVTIGSTQISRTITVTVEPAKPDYIQVVTDTTGIARKADTSLSVFEFERNVDEVLFYAFERDRFGNYIGPATGSQWNSNDPALNVIPQGDGSSAVITRPEGYDFSDSLKVFAEKTVEGCVPTVNDDCSIKSDVEISVVDVGSVGIGPNPFVPGSSRPRDDLPGEVVDFYRNIIDNSNSVGILIAITAPRVIPRAGSGGDRPAKAAIVIYDAVGHVVFRSKPQDLIMANNKTFGLVWDGKNTQGRNVGPGTYLVRSVVTMNNGKRYSSERKIGVTTDGKIRN